VRNPAQIGRIHGTHVTSLSAQMGPLARAKKLADPVQYDRVVSEKMAKKGISGERAKAEYNDSLENPPS